MISTIFNKNQFKILTIFSISPGSKHSRNELKERTKLINMALDNALKQLISSKILLKEKRLLRLNLENEDVKEIIRIISKEYKQLKELPLNIYFLIIDFLNLLNETYEVYLFGSYAKLIFKKDSDIDFAIISNDINTLKRKKINEKVLKLEKKYSKKIELHYFGKDIYKNKKDPLVKEILINGEKLNC